MEKNIYNQYNTTVAGARMGGLSNSETVNVIGFPCMAKFKQNDLGEKKKSSEWHFCGWKLFIDKGSQRRMARLV